MSIEAVISRISQLQAMLAAGARAAPRRRDAEPDQLLDRARRTRPAPAPRQLRLARRRHARPRPPRARPRPAPSLPAGTPYGAEITAAATANGIDPALLAGLVKQESGFNPNAGSGAGARGLTQLMPGTAAGLGVTNVLDPVQSLNGGAKYLKQQLDAFGGDVDQGARRLQRRPRRGAALRRRAARTPRPRTTSASCRPTPRPTGPAPLDSVPSTAGSTGALPSEI